MFEYTILTARRNRKRNSGSPLRSVRWHGPRFVRGRRDQVDDSLGFEAEAPHVGGASMTPSRKMVGANTSSRNFAAL